MHKSLKKFVLNIFIREKLLNGRAIWTLGLLAYSKSNPYQKAQEYI